MNQAGEKDTTCSYSFREYCVHICGYCKTHNNRKNVKRFRHPGLTIRYNYDARYMLDKTCWLFMFPAALGYILGHHWTLYGCSALTLTSALYYNHNFAQYSVIRHIDTAYATSFTVVSTLIGIYQGNVIGVMCSCLAVLIYVTLSKRGEARTHDDPWHVWVHVFGALGFSTLPLFHLIGTHNQSH